MRQRIVEVKVYKKILTCADQTCLGNYVFNGEIHIQKSPVEGEPSRTIFEHKCSICSQIQNFEKKFPEIIYEEVAVDKDLK